MKTILLTLLGLMLYAQAQHEHHMPAADSSAQASPMSHGFSLELPMYMNTSGSGWIPASSPMYGYMKHGEKWMLMGHGSVFLRFNSQDMFGAGSRGDSKADAPNWAMLMAQRRVGKNGLLRLAGMLTLDPLTIGGEGYPLLFQTGETWQGKALVDHQHPHDLVSELSVGYTQRIAPGLETFVYLGYPGEPALGPAAFMHRPSAMYLPDAPLGHHFQDATHIVFGTATWGIRYKALKLEASSFSGKEPDEDRYAFQTPKFDSWSGRASVQVGKALVATLGYGYLAAPETNDDHTDVRRTTASLIYAKQMRSTLWNSSLIWGYNQNINGHDDHTEHSVLIESSLSFGKNALYTRGEWLQKGADELLLPATDYAHHGLYQVAAVSLGYSRDLVELANTRLALGGHLTAYFPQSELAPVYGQMPIGGQVYLHIYPRKM